MSPSENSFKNTLARPANFLLATRFRSRVWAGTGQTDGQQPFNAPPYGGGHNSENQMHNVWY